MGRMPPNVLERAEIFSDRMLDVVQTLERKRVYSRVIDQVVGCGTSVGANACEADHGVSRADFCKSLGIALKELGECRYWLRCSVRRGWIKAERLERLTDESTQLSRILGTMVVRSRAKGAAR